MEMIIEEFRDIVGYEGYYQVSNFGNVKSLTRTIYKTDGTTQTFKDKIKKSTYNTKGYLQTGLTKDTIYKTHKVHRLVAMVFLDNPCDKSQINHIDGVKDNNNLTNLEWSTASENTIHAYSTGLLVQPVGSKHFASKLTEKQVIEIRNTEGVHRIIAEKYGVTRNLITMIKNRKIWKHI